MTTKQPSSSLLNRRLSQRRSISRASSWSVDGDFTEVGAYTSHLCSAAEENLTEDVKRFIRDTFLRFSEKSTTAGGTKSLEATKPQLQLPEFLCDVGVPYKRLPHLLHELGCPMSSDMLKENIFARLEITARPGAFADERSGASPTRKSETVSVHKTEEAKLEHVGYEKVMALVWYFLVQTEISDEDIRGAFTTFDVNNDGGLQAEELEHVLGSLGSSAPVSADNLLAIFQKLHKDKSGCLNLEEFMHLFDADHLEKALLPLIGDQATLKEEEDTLLEIDDQAGTKVPKGRAETDVE